jgi:hypothetical protein
MLFWRRVPARGMIGEPLLEAPSIARSARAQCGTEDGPMESSRTNSPSEAAVAGAAVYSRRLLSTYDIMVLGISNSLIWRCPTAHTLDLYNAHVTSNHLDVGVGTGYFLDRCRFPTPRPRLSLLDLNANSLAFTSRRLRRYAPTVHTGDVLAPLSLPDSYDSIGVNYLLHCLPGTIESKAAAFDNLRPHLARGGSLFGSTILRADAGTSRAGRALMRFYNSRRIFSNDGDTLDGLRAALEARFDAVTVRQVGCVALFSANSRGA